MNDQYKKPILAVTLSTTLLFSSAATVGAEIVVPNDQQGTLELQRSTNEKEMMVSQEPGTGEMQREEAIQSVKELITIPNDYSLASSQYHSPNRWQPFGTWYFEFVKRENNDWQGSISVSVNAVSGELLSYYHNSSEQPSYPPNRNREEAQKLALEFLSRISSSKWDEVALDPWGLDEALPIIDPDEQYHFRYVRMHEGIPYPSNYLAVSVNTNGDIVSFHSTWDDNVEFAPVSESLISEDEALAVYREAGDQQLGLRYVTPWSKDEEVDIAYFWDNSYEDSMTYVDAETGAALNGGMEEIGDEAFQPEPVSTSKLQPHFKNRTTDLTEKEALDHVTRLLNIDLDTFQLESSQFYSNTEYDRNEWNFSFVTTQEDDKYYVSVSVDAKSGMIYHYYSHNSDQNASTDEQRMLSEQALIQRAFDAVKRLAPDIAHETYYIGIDHMDEDNHLAYVRFAYYINGVYVPDRHISVAIDQMTGDIVNFSAYVGYSKYVDYPQPNNLISESVALDTLLNDSKVTLQYETDPHSTDQDQVQTKLVYSLQLPQAQDPLYLNAKTGKWHSTNTGEPIDLNRIPPKDIEGHWAEEALNIMFQYRALDTDEDGNINPNQIITRGEMIKMMIQALHRGHFYPIYGLERNASFNDVHQDNTLFDYVEAAVDLNLLEPNGENLNPNEKLTREELAVIVVRALGYDTLAKRNDLFQLNVSDQEQIEAQGHVSIILNLGIMGDLNGAFQPNKAVTRAEAAVTFQRFLEQRNEFADSPRTYD